MSGNFGRPGIRFRNSGGTGNVISGNYVGTDVSGTTRLGNGTGISIEGPGATVGGTAAGAGNLVSGNTDGIAVASTGTVVHGNRVGTDATGALPLGNLNRGIVLFDGEGTLVGGTSAGEGNLVAFNGGGGVVVLGFTGALTGNPIRANSIHANGGLGIDLVGDGPTANDPGDADIGGNNRQNFPHLSSATPVLPSAGTRVQGTLDSSADGMFLLDFYSNLACSSRPRDFLEGRTYLGAVGVTTNGSGHAVFDAVVPVTIAPGEVVAATATDEGGNTSELSPRIVFSILPVSGSAAGGTSVTLSGTDFAPGATVTIGGVPATGVSVPTSTQITATTPALPAGSANNVVVTNTSGLAGTLPKGWVANFLDVGSGNPFLSFVTRLVSNGVTAGCGGGNYCPNSLVTRAQMSVFLLVSKFGQCYVPPPASGTVFDDVPQNGFGAAFIEVLASSGVTAGCGGGNYCPGSPVTRAQMSVFLLRTLEGPTYVPPDCVTPTFGDVPCSSPFARWVEELVDRNITAGCGGGSYCPGTAVTRGQMAVFLSVTFALP